MFTIWKVNEEEYKLRLTTFYAIQIEKQLGFGLTAAINRITDATVIATILWGALQPCQHGINFKDTCELYDDYIAGGGNLEDMMDIILELLSQVGIGDKPNKPERKNARRQKAEDLTE